MIASQIAIHARGATGYADDSQINGLVRTQNPGVLQTIPRRIGTLDEFHQIGKLDFKMLQALRQQVICCSVQS